MYKIVYYVLNELCLAKWFGDKSIDYLVKRFSPLLELKPLFVSNLDARKSMLLKSKKGESPVTN